MKKHLNKFFSNKIIFGGLFILLCIAYNRLIKSIFISFFSNMSFDTVTHNFIFHLKHPLLLTLPVNEHILCFSIVELVVGLVGGFATCMFGSIAFKPYFYKIAKFFLVDFDAADKEKTVDSEKPKMLIHEKETLDQFPTVQKKVSASEDNLPKSYQPCVNILNILDKKNKLTPKTKGAIKENVDLIQEQLHEKDLAVIKSEARYDRLYKQYRDHQINYTIENGDYVRVRKMHFSLYQKAWDLNVENYKLGLKHNKLVTEKEENQQFIKDLAYLLPKPDNVGEHEIFLSKTIMVVKPDIDKYLSTEDIAALDAYLKKIYLAQIHTKADAIKLAKPDVKLVLNDNQPNKIPFPRTPYDETVVQVLLDHDPHKRGQKIKFDTLWKANDDYDF